MFSRLAAFVPMLFAVCLAPATAAAQGVELGIDLEFDYTTDDPNVTVITIPNGDFRAAFPVNSNVSIEPRFSIQYARANGNSLSLIDIQLGVLWHFSTDRTRSTGYFRPFFGHIHSGGSLGGGDASSLGGGIGFKLPQGDRLAARLEAGFEHSLEDGVSDQIFALIGLSFYTR
jgi:hypothetical protein